MFLKVEIFKIEPFPVSMWKSIIIQNTKKASYTLWLAVQLCVQWTTISDGWCELGGFGPVDSMILVSNERYGLAWLALSICRSVIGCVYIIELTADNGID